MTKKKTICIFRVLVFALFFFTISCIIFNKNFNETIKLQKDNSHYIKSSESWKLSSPIRIDYDSGLATAAASEPWCTGSGKMTDPYIIKNLIIDAQGYDYGIFIYATTAFLEIRNCTIFNTEFDWYHGSIFLYGVVNCKLIENNCSLSDTSGMYIDNCISITILRNIIFNNSRHGIETDLITNVTIDDNKICFNNQFGCTIYGTNVSISNNEVIYNGKSGIYLDDCFASNITNNYVVGNGERGIYTPGGTAGIALRGGCENCAIKLNNAHKNYAQGIYIAGSDNNIIEKNNVSLFNARGIILRSSKNNVVIDNTANNNTRCGIQLYQDSSYNLIKNNTANNNREYGIHLFDTCSYNMIRNNTANNNTKFGIFLEDHCTLNEIIRNIVIDNKLWCICFDTSSEDNYFEENGNCSPINVDDITKSNPKVDWESTIIIIIVICIPCIGIIVILLKRYKYR